MSKPIKEIFKDTINNLVKASNDIEKAHSHLNDYINLNEIQKDHREWSNKNFGDQPSWVPLFGIVEEVGELTHSYIKRYQNIRGTTEEHNKLMQDACGDIVLYLLDFCDREGFSLNQILQDTLEKVHSRDWKQNNQDGSNANIEVDGGRYEVESFKLTDNKSNKAKSDSEKVVLRDCDGNILYLEDPVQVISFTGDVKTTGRVNSINLRDNIIYVVIDRINYAFHPMNLRKIRP